MIAWPAEFNARKEAIFTALAEADTGGHRFLTPRWSVRGFPETTARVAVALSRAKRQPAGLARTFKALLIRLQYNGTRRWFARNSNAVAVAWNGMGGSRQAFLMAAKDAGAATLFAELAPFPGRITLDPLGVNAENSVPHEPRFFADWAGSDPARTGDAWRQMGQTLTARPSRRADVGQSTAPLPETPFLFCPLQVPSDSQVTLFSGWCGGMAGFLSALNQAAQGLPQGWHLRLKEHPSAKTPLTDLIAPLLASGKVILDNATDSFAQLAAGRAVVTLNSSMGLQAFFHDKPVITLGRAFFARAGLVTPANDQPHLNALFADPDALQFDPSDRARFMNWLDQVYYPPFTPDTAPHNLSALTEKLHQARNIRDLQAQALSPQPILR